MNPARVLVVLMFNLYCIHHISAAGSFNTQLLNGNAFLQSDYVEVAVGPCGNFASTIDAPTGFHPRGNGMNSRPRQLGFVANPAKDNWTKYIGDYFLPGTPEEGFGLSIGAYNYNNNLICSLSQIPGSVIDVQSTPQEQSATWQGSINGLAITAKTYIPSGAIYFVTQVTLTNTTLSPIDSIYYMRNVDPDQGVNTPGSTYDYLTYNSIIYQTPNSCGKALVSATTKNGSGEYLGLGSMDARAKVTTGGFNNRNAKAIWTGYGFSQAGTNYAADNAISIAFRIGSLKPNESTTFAYAYILNSEDLEKALVATNLGLNINASKLSVCQGDSVTYTAASLVKATSPVYEWKINGTIVGTNSNTFSTNSLANNDVLSCKITAATECSPVTTSATTDIKIKVNQPTFSTTRVSICRGDSCHFNGKKYGAAGTYIAHITNVAGCDSAATLILSIKEPTSSTTKVSICKGDSYTFNGKAYNLAGSYTAHLTNSVGCDSAATLILTIKEPTTSTTKVSICRGDTYKFNGVNYTAAGTFVAHLTNSVGCDSAAVLELSLKEPSSSTTNSSYCRGDTYMFAGFAYNAAGTYLVHLTNAVGCDSAATLVLKELPVYYKEQTLHMFKGDSYKINGHIYADNGDYTDTFKTIDGCDSVIVSHLYTSVIPNTISPNGDGVNDVFLKGLHVKIYNRNGLLLHEGYDGWDGKFNGRPVARDTYFYIVYYEYATETKTKEGYVVVAKQ
ncbi:gliding motility-associated C-terminal domain-containing protein [Paludibacter sp.]|uniref:T9SS type B sorting domain-containing protein n=1 Tax=Paludibacter sp. TaxID=1898105 RepID=UPI001353C85B|nr:gliding motility-associated C-terminal domain-containing protein [Paludibacter sp.]MTK53540.1 gliding motility-associated C-terminal domain-containing protein [Paludibacter sp.]